MKKSCLILIVSVFAISQIFAQKLSIGDRAPELKVKEWVNSAPSPEKHEKAQLVEFFFSSSKPSLGRLPVLESIAKRYSSKLNVVVMAKEPREKITSIMNESVQRCFVALDDSGKTFSNYGVQFVPFCVLIDAKGCVQWFGNSVSMTEEAIGKYF